MFIIRWLCLVFLKGFGSTALALGMFSDYDDVSFRFVGRNQLEQGEGAWLLRLVAGY